MSVVISERAMELGRSAQLFVLLLACYALHQDNLLLVLPTRRIRELVAAAAIDIDSSYSPGSGHTPEIELVDCVCGGLERRTVEAPIATPISRRSRHNPATRFQRCSALLNGREESLWHTYTLRIR